MGENVSYKTNRLKTKELVFFCNQLGMLIEAGVPLLEALGLLRDVANYKGVRKIVETLFVEVEKGYALSEVIQSIDAFPKLCVGIITSGEMSGQLSEALVMLGDYYEKQLKLISKVQKAFFYPSIMIIVLLIVGTGMLYFVLPRFTQIFDSLGGELPNFTKQIMSASLFLKQYCLELLIGASVILGSFRLLFSFQGALRYWCEIKMKLPGVKQIITLKWTHIFCDTLASLIIAGVPIVKGLEITQEVVQNPIIQEDLQESINIILSGGTLGDGFKNSEIWPKLLKNMIVMGDQIGSLDKVLLKMSCYYYQLLNTNLERKIVLIEPILTLGIGIVVAIMMAGIMLPMYTLITQMNW